MKGFRVFAAYYSIILTTTLLIGSLFYLPQPQGFIIAVAFAPVTLFFWINATAPKKVSSSVWSLRLIIVTLLLASLGLFAYSLTRFLPSNGQTETTPSSPLSQDTNEDDLYNQLEYLSSSIDEIKDELFAIGAAQEGLSKILGTKSAIDELSDFNLSPYFDFDEDAATNSAVETVQ